MALSLPEFVERWKASALSERAAAQNHFIDRRSHWSNSSAHPEAPEKQLASHLRHVEVRSPWDASTQPTWLTSEVFSRQIQPLLASISTSAIRSRIGVSRWYAGRIREGYRPHPRHWLALAELVGVSADVSPRESPIFPPG